MSYQDVPYLNIPSFWSEFFSDKQILDAIFATSLDIVSNSYGNILKEYSNQSIYTQDRYSKEDWYLMKADKSAVTVLRIGNDTYEILPIDTPVMDFNFISSKPNLNSAVTVYGKDSVRIVPYASDVAKILKSIGLTLELINKPKLLIAKNGYLMSSTEFSDGLESTYDSIKYCSISVVKSFKFTSLYAQLHAGTTATLNISIGSVTFQVLATKAEELNGAVLVYLDTRISLPLTGPCVVRVGESLYRAEVLGVTISETTLNIWANKASNDYKSLYFKFGSSFSDSILTSSGVLPDLLKSFRQLALTSPTIANLGRALAVTQGSKILTGGESNNEEIKSVDLDTGRIITSSNIYDHARPFSINSSILRRCPKILINGIQTNTSLTYMLTCSYENTGLNISSSLYSFFSEADVVAMNSYYAAQYANKLLINSGITAVVLYIGRDYLVIESTSNIVSLTSLSVVVADTIEPLYSVPFAANISVHKLNTVDPLASQVDFADTTLSIVDYGRIDLAKSSTYVGLYIPDYLYNTTHLRRRISNDLYDNNVGEMPIHLVGDYGISVAEPRTYKSSAYYIFSDFMHHNMYYVSYNMLDLDLGLIPQNIDNLNRLYGPSGCLPIHRQYNALVSSVQNNIVDSLDNSLTKLSSDNLSSLMLPSDSLVEDSSVYSRYLHLHFDYDVPTQELKEILYNGLPLAYVYLDIYERLVEVLLDEDAPSDSASDYSVNGLIPIELVRVASVGGYNSLLGNWTPLVGSNSPVLSKKANSILNQGKLSDVGPFITIS